MAAAAAVGLAVGGEAALADALGVAEAAGVAAALGVAAGLELACGEGDSVGLALPEAAGVGVAVEPTKARFTLDQAMSNLGFQRSKSWSVEVKVKTSGLLACTK